MFQDETGSRGSSRRSPNALGVDKGNEWRPVFVVGVPRSGTTLLQSVLSKGRDTYSMPETHFFEALLPGLSLRVNDPIGAAEVEQALDQAFKLMNLRIEGANRAKLVELAEKGSLNCRQLFMHFVEKYRPAEDHGRIMRPLEKTPGHVQHLYDIVDAFPLAKFVHIVREPKNAISSLLKIPFVKAHWLIWHCVRWNATLAYVEQFSEEYPGSILTVKYEDLVTESRRTVAEVCAFLEIEYSDEMLINEQQSEDRPLILDRETWKRDARGPMVANQPDAWRERISEAHGWFIERLTKRRSARYGYRATASPGLWLKVATWQRQWRYLRYNPQEMGVSLWLLDRCIEMGGVGPARRLAMGLAVGDVRMLEQGRVRTALRGSRQVGYKAAQNGSSPYLVDDRG